MRTLEEAMARHGAPEIFNSDQGVQFTSEEFLAVLERIHASLDYRTPAEMYLAGHARPAQEAA